MTVLVPMSPIARGDLIALHEIRRAQQHLDELELIAAERALAAGKPFAGFRR